MKNIDILAIGDIATDVFIKIKNAETKCDLSGEHCKLCLNYGGKIPYESSTICHGVGNSSNVAVALSRININSALKTNIGGDSNGVDCLNILKEENINTDFVKIEKDKLTSYHYVLWYEKEHTIMTKHEKYEYEWSKENELTGENSPSWLYLSSLGESPFSFYSQIINYLEINPQVKLAFQPGTFQINLGKDNLKDIYKNTDLFLCNHEEAQKILQIEEKDISKLLIEIYNLGPKIVVITDDIRGAYSYDGNEILFMKAIHNDTFIESTGAGDAFGGAFLSALFLGKSIKDALIWGSVNARSVVQYIGPHKGLLDKNQIEEYITNMLSDEYNPTKIN